MARKKPAYLHTILTATTIVLFWRGTWGLMDLYLFPNNAFLSYTSSIVLGILILILNRDRIEELL